MTLEEKVQRLQDRIDIQELMSRYCRYADTLDSDALTSLFTEDGEADFANGRSPILRGRQEILDFLTTALAGVVSSSHHVANIELVFKSSDSVIAHAYMNAWQRFKGYPETADFHLWARYELRFLRSPEGWRYSRLRLISAGQSGDARIGEQMGRPWPPQFD